jgi:ATP-dependent exoDNAse (exonuclease V) beta subunit
MDTLGEDKWYKEALEISRKELIDRNKDEMIRLMSELIDHIEKGLGKYELYSILKRNIYPLAVLNEILQVMQQIMESEGSIHISELDKRIARVVNEEPVPFIYERLGEKYKHFLIDEFQDTSVLEWQNLLPLVENSLAEAHMSMLVGDAKQAIYRFKGGEVEQLVRFPEIFGKPDTPEMDMREKSLERNFNEHDLPYNYRSREAIVNFNNAFYAFCAGLLPDHLKTIYEADPQKMKKKKPGGEVFIRFLESNTESGEKEQAYLDEIKRSIHDLIERKGYRWRDIAILCRGNAEASRIARHLMVSGIDVVSAESLLLSSSREVNLIVHCLDHLAGEHDKVAILGILSYVFADDTGALNKYAADCISGADNKEPEQKLEDILLQQGLAYDPPALKRMGLYERVEALIRIFSLGREADPYLVFFLDAVHDYERNRKNDPEGFTSHWRDKRHNYSIKVPEEMDAVRVLTIHKAKGLGFPVVIYPFANEKVRIRDDRSWVALSEEDLPELKVGLVNINRRLEQSAFAGVFQREMHLKQLDLLNLLYVATTRPRERLFILCDRPAKASEQADNIPGLLRAWLEDSGRWQEDQDSYRFGSSETLESSTKEHVPSIRLKSHVSTNWRDSIRLSGHASRYWDLDDESRNLEWGNLIHGILSKIDTVDDLPRAMYEEVNRGSLPEAKAMETEQKLKKILESEDLRRFFDGNYKLKNEVTIMRPGGQEYRPDRLMIRNRHAVIIDYKTGSEDDKHVRQIRQYAELLREIGYEKTEGYLLYLGDDFHLKMV